MQYSGLPYWIGLMRSLLPINIEANFENKVLIIVLTTYENVLNSVLPCPTETLLDILKLGFFAAGTVHSSLWKTRKKMGLHYFFWLDFFCLKIEPLQTCNNGGSVLNKSSISSGTLQKKQLKELWSSLILNINTVVFILGQRKEF